MHAWYVVLKLTTKYSPFYTNEYSQKFTIKCAMLLKVYLNTLFSSGVQKV